MHPGPAMLHARPALLLRGRRASAHAWDRGASGFVAIEDHHEDVSAIGDCSEPDRSAVEQNSPGADDREAGAVLSAGA